MRSFVRLGPLAGLVLALGASCLSLPTIEPDTCGNAIVEPNAPSPEDCDTFATEAGTACRAPGDELACHFDCSTGADGKALHTCPSRWVCGEDGTCRPPGGGFVAAGEPFGVDARRLGAADLDGDHRADLVATGAASSSVHWFDSEAQVASSLALPATTVPPALADLSADGVADLVFPSQTVSGIGVLLGQTDRTFAPKAYPTIVFPPGARAQMLGLDSTTLVPTAATTSPIVVASSNAGLAVLRPSIFDGSEPAMVGVIPGQHSLDDLSATAIARGTLDENPLLARCPEAAFGFAGDKTIFLVVPCTVDGLGNVGWTGLKDSVKAIPLPVGVTMGEHLWIVDVDGDGHLDVVVSGKKNSDTNVLVVAHGAGALPLSPSFDELTTPSGDAGSVLAVGDLDGDGTADFVTERGIAIRTPGGFFPAVTRQGFETVWTEALIGDMNDDGLPDVFAGANDEVGVDFYAGTPPLAPNAVAFNHSVVPTSAPVDLFSVGDFDGDGVRDVALNQMGAAGEDQPSILFGRRGGAPEPPLALGEIDNVQQTLAADLPEQDELDQVTDLAALAHSADGTLSVSLLLGSTDRFMLAAFGLSHPSTGPGGMQTIARAEPLRAVVGRFTKKDVPHPDLATLAISLSQDASVSFWVSPATDDAEMTTSVEGEPIPLDFDPKAAGTKLHVQHIARDAQLAAGDLDGDGTDELVAAIPLSKGGTELVVAKTDDAGTAKVGATGTITSTLRAARDGQMDVADVDGDGSPDLLLLADDQGTGKLYVFWGKGGTIDFASPAVITAPKPDGQEGASVLGFATLQADLDAPSEIAFVSGYGAWLADFTAKDPRTVPESIALPGAMHATSVAAADFDGDGLADVALADGQLVQVLRQQRAAASSK